MTVMLICKGKGNVRDGAASGFAGPATGRDYLASLGKSQVTAMIYGTCRDGICVQTLQSKRRGDCTPPKLFGDAAKLKK